MPPRYFCDIFSISLLKLQIMETICRQAYQSEDSKQPSETCLREIQRVMRQRAISVELQPEIEEVCVRDLADLCSDKSKKGEEMECLQDHLENLDDECHKAVASFTELEDQHIELNPFISKYCKKMIDTLCNSENLNEGDTVMDCLIENKNNPLVKSNPVCRGSIEHFQIISLKDYHFTYKFKVACKPYVVRLCGEQVRNKNEVVACLSEHILNATINGVRSTIAKDCRQQLKAQIFQQREKIDFDPGLKQHCSVDIRKFCTNVQSGNAQVRNNLI